MVEVNNNNSPDRTKTTNVPGGHKQPDYTPYSDSSGDDNNTGVNQAKRRELARSKQGVAYYG